MPYIVRKILNRLIYACVFLSSINFIYPEIKLNEFFLKNNSQLLNDLFTLNLGIMKFKGIGNLNDIDPIDSQNVVNAIKNVLEKVPAVKLSRREAVLKAMNTYVSDLNDNDTNEKNSVDFLKEKLFLSDLVSDSNLIYEFFLKMKNSRNMKKNQNIQGNQVSQTYADIARLWFENIDNPFFLLNIGEPFDRIILSEENICSATKVNDRGHLDYLIDGEIEKIDRLYFITIYVYSDLLKKRIGEVYFVSDSQNITKNTVENFSRIIPNIFSIKYAALTIKTPDNDTMIYLDTDYLGKKEALVEFLIPGNYVITLKKENYEDAVENVTLGSYENKTIELALEKEKDLQVINFYIEPLGTKIYINSLYQGKSPFKKALPRGSYIIMAKNDLYESYRYILEVNEVASEEKTVVFHLKTRDTIDYFKLKKNLYYASFWNFTFSLATMVPLIVFAYQYWNESNIYRIFFYKYYNNGDHDMANKLKPKVDSLEITANILYGFAATMVAYTVLSAGWLFFALADYLKILGKKDFIPILEYYHKIEGDEEFKIGLTMRL